MAFVVIMNWVCFVFLLCAFGGILEYDPSLPPFFFVVFLWWSVILNTVCFLLFFLFLIFCSMILYNFFNCLCEFHFAFFVCLVVWIIFSCNFLMSQTNKKYVQLSIYTFFLMFFIPVFHTFGILLNSFTRAISNSKRQLTILHH